MRLLCRHDPGVLFDVLTEGCRCELGCFCVCGQLTGALALLSNLEYPWILCKSGSGTCGWSPIIEVGWHVLQVALRVRREGSDYIVEACVPRPAAATDSTTHHCSVKTGSGAPDR
jgi:hypothetical protein